MTNDHGFTALRRAMQARGYEASGREDLVMLPCGKATHRQKRTRSLRGKICEKRKCRPRLRMLHDWRSWRRTGLCPAWTDTGSTVWSSHSTMKSPVAFGPAYIRLGISPKLKMPFLGFSAHTHTCKAPC